MIRFDDLTFFYQNHVDRALDYENKTAYLYKSNLGSIRILYGTNVSFIRSV
jgi:hypothetical protein